jgi:hypothetical protein
MKIILKNYYRKYYYWRKNMKKNKYLITVILSFLLFSCNIQKNIEDKKDYENLKLINTMEFVGKTFDNVNITLDKIIEQLKENENKIKLLEDKIKELENNMP